MIQVFNVYGQSGGSKEDIAIAEAILEAVREEKDEEQHLPTLIVGDLNADPKRLQNINELIEEEGWIDVGLHADWWEALQRRTPAKAGQDQSHQG